MEIEITPEPGADATEAAIIQRIQRKELDERLKVQFLNGIDIRIRRQIMSREAETFDEALKAAISEETIEQLTSHPQGIVRTVRDSEWETDSFSQDKIAQLMAAMQKLTARVERLTRTSPTENARTPPRGRDNRENNRENHNNLPFQREGYHSVNTSRRPDRPNDQTYRNRNPRGRRYINSNASPTRQRKESPWRRESENDQKSSQPMKKNLNGWTGIIRSIQDQQPRYNYSTRSPFPVSKQKRRYTESNSPRTERIPPAEGKERQKLQIRSARRRTAGHRKAKQLRIQQDNTDTIIQPPVASRVKDALTTVLPSLTEEQFNPSNETEPEREREEAESEFESEASKSEPEGEKEDTESGESEFEQSETEITEEQESTPPYALYSRSPVPEQPW
ncbi:uncharacterized protein, partial [Centruroides vittatus]|uniref:uncharacterized protein n=1 Tax=Centruroides vittatus TaxID=120091 RepID=UPI0035101A92